MGTLGLNTSFLLSGTANSQFNLGLKCLEGIKPISNIHLDKLQYTYYNEPPKYVDSKYEPNVYDISFYIEDQ
jgi:hypothetical protein